MGAHILSVSDTATPHTSRSRMQRFSLLVTILGLFAVTNQAPNNDRWSPIEDVKAREVCVTEEHNLEYYFAADELSSCNFTFAKKIWGSWKSFHMSCALGTYFEDGWCRAGKCHEVRHGKASPEINTESTGITNEPETTTETTITTTTTEEPKTTTEKLDITTITATEEPTRTAVTSETTTTTTTTEEPMTTTTTSTNEDRTTTTITTTNTEEPTTEDPTTTTEELT